VVQNDLIVAWAILRRATPDGDPKSDPPEVCAGSGKTGEERRKEVGNEAGGFLEETLKR